MDFHFQVDENIILELQSPFQDKEMFQLVNENREFIGEHVFWANKVQRLSHIQEYMQRDLTGMANERRQAWLIRYKSKVAGRIGLFITVPELQECELFYFLGKNFTGKGIITKCAKVVVDFAINVLNLQHVLIGFSVNNPKSGAVAERLGFQHEYTMRDSIYYRKKWDSLHFWGMIAPDWKSGVKPEFIYQIDDSLSLQLYQLHQSQTIFQLIMNNYEEFSRLFARLDGYSLLKEQDNARKWLRRYAKGSGLSLTIQHDGTPVGNISPGINPKNNEANIGYWLDKNARGQGIMTRCLPVLMKEAFTRYQAQRIRIVTPHNNSASRALAERAGMQLELIKRDETRIQNQFIDYVQYGILNTEWKEASL